MAESAEEQITVEATALAERFAAFTEEPYFREAIVKMSIREIAWAFYHAFPTDREVLAEQLQSMAGCIENGPQREGD